MIPIDWVSQANERIADYVRRTPLTYDEQRGWFLKWENQQATGSFKVRGALNKTLVLDGWEREAGLVTASAGNHGLGVALAGKMFSVPVTVFVPENAVPTKVQALRAGGAQVKTVKGGYAEAEAAAIEYSQEMKGTWISAYNDPHVIAGQGTIALEILGQDSGREIRSVVVPAGGGGLVSGIGATLKTLAPQIYIVAAQSEASPYLHALYTHGSQAGVQEDVSLADGLAGAVEANSVTIPLVRHYVDQFVLVTEEEIGYAVSFAQHLYGQKIEGSAAVALAAALQGNFPQPIAIIISGGNIQPEVHAQLCTRYRVPE